MRVRGVKAMSGMHLLTCHVDLSAGKHVTTAEHTDSFISDQQLECYE